MGRKAVGLVYCVMHVKEPRTLVKEIQQVGSSVLYTVKPLYKSEQFLV